MTTTDLSVEAAPERRGAGAWRIVGLVGELLITLAVVLLLAVVYEVWWTNIVAQRNVERQRQELTQTWEQQRQQQLTQPLELQQPVPPAVVVPIPSQAFGLMYIPRLQDHVWAMPLIEGVELSDLRQGIGHFPSAAMPGDAGNAAFAGHRQTNGSQLGSIDQLVAGDKVYIETAAGWYTYQLTHDDLVAPTDVWVVDPVPGQPAGTVPTERMLTLITCHPLWRSTQRWVWWGSLVEQRTWEQGAPPELAAMLQGGV